MRDDIGRERRSAVASADFMDAEIAPEPLVVGTDIVDVREVRRSLEAFGERYLKRVFTDREIAFCLSHADPAPRLASRFAVKEAAIKVLRPRADQAIPWTHLETVRREGGHPELALSGEARVLADAAGFWGFSTSLSHEAEYATAVVVGFRERDQRRR